MNAPALAEMTGGGRTSISDHLAALTEARPAEPQPAGRFTYRLRPEALTTVADLAEKARESAQLRRSCA